MDYSGIAQQILDKVGGKANVAAAAHCATRLRLALNDDSKAELETLENIEGVKGVFKVAGQTQIILGSGTVNLVYNEFCQLTGQAEMSTTEVATAGAQKATLFSEQ